ncbi:MAG TPA: class I SAM-dependent methyltransferase [Gammaproteobacteria bacterium]
MKSLSLTEDLYNYLLSVSLRESEILRRLREETARLPMAIMQIAPDQGQFMALLVKLIGARKAIEVGVFTGYSALSIASALPPTGRLIACDISVEWTNIAKQYWQEAGMADRIDLRIAPALDTLDSLIAEGQQGTFDFVFIDADKVHYPDYYERALLLVRPGGLIAVDNVLWFGAVIDDSKQDKDTVAIRAFNKKLCSDNRISLSLVPIGDGLTLARKR